MKLSSSLLLAVLLALPACSSVEYRPNAGPTVQSDVRVLYEYPQDGKFKSLGTIEANFYKPGWKSPTVNDVMPQLTAKVAAAGGNALIVRSHQVGQFDRNISVTAEVLLLEP